MSFEDENTSIDIFWKPENLAFTAKIYDKKILMPPVDLALLRLDQEIQDQPYVIFDEYDPELSDTLYIFGFPKGEGIDYSNGDSATFLYEGESCKKDILLYKLKGRTNYRWF